MRSRGALGWALKVESLFDLDLPLARRLTRGLRRLHSHAELEQRVPKWREVLAAGLRRAERLEATRRAPPRPWLVDLVLPLCRASELRAVQAGLELLAAALPRRTDATDGWPEESVRGRQAAIYNRLRGPWRHAQSLGPQAISRPFHERNKVNKELDSS